MVAARRSVSSGILAAAALVPAAVWFLPALLLRQAPSYRDQGDFFFPLKLYTADRLLAGEVPLWNPLSGAGEPWLANAQSGVFYPPTALFFLPSPALAAALFLLLHFAIAAWGGWRFLKEEGVSDAGATLGAAALAGGCFAASLSVYWNHFAAWAYLPAIVSLARSGLVSRRSLAGLALLTGLQAMAGSPEMTLATIAAAAVFCWESRPCPDGWLDRPRSGRMLSLAAAAGLGLSLAAWVLLPMGELALNSGRKAALPAAERERGAVELSGFGSALGLTGREASGTDYLVSLCLGPLALVPAIALFAERERRRIAFLLALLAACGILLAMAAPPGPWLRSLPPFNRLRYPAKALALTFFAVPMMAGLGTDSFRFVKSRRIALLLAALCVAGLSASLFSRMPRSASLAGGAGLAALLLLALTGARPGGAELPRVFLAGAAATALAVSLAFAGRALPRFSPEESIRRIPESIPFLARITGRVLTPSMEKLARWAVRDSRFDAATLERQREALVGYTNLIAGVSTVRTAAAMPTEAASAIVGAVDAPFNPIAAAGAAAGRVYWTPFLPGQMGSRKVGDFYRAPINPYRPRLSFTSGWRIETDSERAWKEVAGGARDWSREVALDREPEPRPAARGKRSFVVARIAEDHPERVAAQVSSDAAGILVLADLYYPGWRAETDGRPARLMRADGLFRAVALPAGSHTVVFRYRPVSFFLGSAISLIALVAIALIALAGGRVGRPA